MNYADAFALLNEYVTDQSLVRHCMSVESAMPGDYQNHECRENDDASQRLPPFASGVKGARGVASQRLPPFARGGKGGSR